MQILIILKSKQINLHELIWTMLYISNIEFSKVYQTSVFQKVDSNIVSCAVFIPFYTSIQYWIISALPGHSPVLPSCPPFDESKSWTQEF